MTRPRGRIADDDLTLGRRACRRKPSFCRDPATFDEWMTPQLHSGQPRLGVQRPVKTPSGLGKGFVSRLRSQAAPPRSRQDAPVVAVAALGESGAAPARPAPCLGAVLSAAETAAEPNRDAPLVARTPLDPPEAGSPRIDVALRGAIGEGPFALDSAHGPPTIPADAPKPSRWAQAAEGVLVLIAHTAALASLLSLGAPLPAAPEAVEVTVVAASDVSAATSPNASAAGPQGQAASDSRAPQQPEAKASSPEPAPEATAPPAEGKKAPEPDPAREAAQAAPEAQETPALLPETPPPGQTRPQAAAAEAPPPVVEPPPPEAVAQQEAPPVPSAEDPPPPPATPSARRATSSPVAAVARLENSGAEAGSRSAAAAGSDAASAEARGPACQRAPSEAGNRARKRRNSEASQGRGGEGGNDGRDAGRVGGREPRRIAAGPVGGRERVAVELRRAGRGRDPVAPLLSRIRPVARRRGGGRGRLHHRAGRQGRGGVGGPVFRRGGPRRRRATHRPVDRASSSALGLVLGQHDDPLPRRVKPGQRPVALSTPSDEVHRAMSLSPAQNALRSW